MTRVAIVTGGTRGIGKAICIALRDRGVTVVANYGGNVEKAREFTAETGIAAYRWDVGDHELTLASCAEIEAEVGPIDIVINNAGVTRDGVLHKMSYDDWNEVMRINLGGCFNMAKATFPGMRERGWGRIVNIGSVNGQAGQFCHRVDDEHQRRPAYVLSRHGAASGRVLPGIARQVFPAAQGPMGEIGWNRPPYSPVTIASPHAGEPPCPYPARCPATCPPTPSRCLRPITARSRPCSTASPAPAPPSATLRWPSRSATN
jgi:hypothetical protein